MSIIDRAKDKLTGIFTNNAVEDKRDNMNTDTEQKLVDLVLSDFNIFKSDRSKQEAQWEKEEDFYRGDHWKGLRDEDDTSRPNATDNYVLAYTESICGKLAGWTPYPNFEEMEENDVGKARALNDFIPYELGKIGFKSTHRQAVLRMVKHGPLIYKVLYDPTIEGGRGQNRYEGRNDVIAVDFSTFYPDPRVDSFKSMHRMGAIIERTVQNMEYFQDRWKEKGKYVTSGTTTTNVFTSDSYQNRTNTANLLEYWYRGVPKYMSKEDKKLFRERAQETLEKGVDPSEYEAKARGTMSGIHCIYISESGVFLEHKSYIYDHGQYPFSARTLYPLEGNIWGKGFVRDMIQPQVFLNAYNELIMDSTSRMGVPAIMYEQDAITKPNTWANNRSKTGAMLPTAPGALSSNKIREVEGKDVPSTIFNAIQLGLTSLQKITGQFDSANGQATSTVTSGEQAKALMAAAGTRLNTASDVITDALQEVFMMYVELIAQFYTTERIARVNGRSVSMSRDAIISTIDDTEWQPDEMSGDEQAAPEMYQNEIESDMNPEELPPMMGQESDDMSLSSFSPMEPRIVKEEYVPEFDIKVNVGVDKPQDREYWLQLAFNLLNLRDPITNLPFIDGQAISFVLQNGHLEPMDVIKQRIDQEAGQQQQVEQLNQQAQQLVEQNQQLQQQVEQLGGQLQQSDAQTQQFHQQTKAAEIDQRQQQIDLEKVKAAAQIAQQTSNTGQF
ncbi:hypothetical protein ACFSGI_08995 [Paenibacillus nicotianae]|uniref:Portal protein n=1 Tax=Paenibacillus nicotianae TaxID=1526551 RepID=A0ABW4URP9_9BACL